MPKNSSRHKKTSKSYAHPNNNKGEHKPIYRFYSQKITNDGELEYRRKRYNPQADETVAGIVTTVFRRTPHNSSVNTRIQDGLDEYHYGPYDDFFEDDEYDSSYGSRSEYNAPGAPLLSAFIAAALNIKDVNTAESKVNDADLDPSVDVKNTP